MTAALAHAAPPSAAPLVAPPVASTAASPVAVPLAGGPGWFESSWDLLMGLDVQELSPAEPCQAAGGGAEPPPSAT
jgi:hypothetical protein